MMLMFYSVGYTLYMHVNDSILHAGKGVVYMILQLQRNGLSLSVPLVKRVAKVAVVLLALLVLILGGGRFFFLCLRSSSESYSSI